MIKKYYILHFDKKTVCDDDYQSNIIEEEME